MFLPKDYKAPVGSTSFMKLEEGQNRFRILSEAVIGWEGWKNNKPFRREGIEQNITADEVDTDSKYGKAKPKINHFWAFLVFDYKDKQVKILEITQKSIMKSIEGLVNDPDWGDPVNYDLGIERVEGQRVSYNVNPYPPKKVDPKIAQALKDTELDVMDLFKDADEEGMEDFKPHMVKKGKR